MKIIISKEKIYGDVTRTSLYTGAKHPDGDPAMLSRVAVIDADRPLLCRFCEEALATAAFALRQVLTSVTTNEEDISLVFRLSQAADDTQAAGIADSLADYMKNAVISRWLAFSDKAEAETYSTEALRMLDECLRKALYKRKPIRPEYNK